MRLSRDLLLGTSATGAMIAAGVPLKGDEFVLSARVYDKLRSHPTVLELLGVEFGGECLSIDADALYSPYLLNYAGDAL